MVMLQARQRFANLHLHVDRPAHQAIVFECRESLRGHEFELRDEVIAGMRLEHAEVRCVAQLEFALWGGCLRAGRAHQRRTQGLKQEFPPAGHR